MRFGLCVRFGVDLHVRLIEEGRRAHPAPTGGETWEWKNKWDEEVTQKRTHRRQWWSQRSKETAVFERGGGGMKK